MSTAICPDADTLAQFVLGEIDGEAADVLDSHVADCLSCGDSLSRLRAEDDLVGLMRRPSSVLANVDATLVESLLIRLRTTGANGPSSVSSPEFLDPPAAPGELGTIGPYRVLRELGRGGMGVVYVAEDPRLGRRVALKVIRDARLDDPQSEARFEQEATALARLSHPHVVQVFEVGRHRGRPYLAMEYVAGGTLADRFQGRPQSPALLAGLLAAVADAIQFAHDQGVFHRDLKPANILIGPMGPAGTPKVADFGLARRPTDQALTLTEDLLGTPAYMAPEMTRGGAARAAAGVDIYSLGAVLYEGLTGRPPFRGETLADTLEQVRSLDPVPPRRLQPKVPRDLETICLKCLGKDPRRRYASAAALADDLRCFLDGRPIMARPAGPFERLQKWARRKPAWAALAGVSVVAVFALLGVGANYERSLRKEVERANHNADEARREKDRARENYREARDAMAKMLRHAGDPRRGDLPRIRELRHDQQDAALAFYERIAAAQPGDDPELRWDVAQARVVASNLQFQLGRTDDARENLRQTIPMLRSLVEEKPDEPEYRLALADSLSLRAFFERGDEAQRTLEEALHELEALHAKDPKSWPIRATMARMHHRLGTDALLSLRDLVGRNLPWSWYDLRIAAEHFDAAVRLRRGMLDEDPRSREQRLALAQTQTNQLLLWKGTRSVAEQTSLVAELERSYEELLKEDPNEPTALIALAVLRISWADVQERQGQANDALKALGRSIEALEAFRKREPDWTDARDKLFSTYGTRALVLDRLGRYAEAAADYRHVIELAPAERRPGYRLDRVGLLIHAKDFTAAAVELDTAVAEPLGQTNVEWLAIVLRHCQSLLDTPQRDRGLAVARKALDESRKRLKPEDWAKWLAELRRKGDIKAIIARPELLPNLR